MTRRKTVLAIGVAVVVVTIGVLLLVRAQHLRLLAEARNVTLEGAIILHDPDPNEQLPIAGAVITATDGVQTATATSDASGYFKFTLKKAVLSDKPAAVTVVHPGYRPWQFTVQTGRLATPRRLLVVALDPIRTRPAVRPDRAAETSVNNIKVRYTINAQTEMNVGSAVKTFSISNRGNVPCNHGSLCSPDGRWKAVSGSVSLDAGSGNAFANVRASCIAGPCPFTRLENIDLTVGGEKLTVTALNWSDTATFLVEAEVFHAAIGSEVRELYPVKYGQALNFTVPPSQEGVSLEADLNGAPMVFPLGPNLSLSWATCTVRNGKEEDKTVTYRCELKPGYRFG